MTYGLIGEKLSHSWSKIIHEKATDYTYDLCPLSKDEVEEFMTRKKFHGINVTIPYKQTVIPYLDIIDETAKSIGAVNTVVNRNGKLYGYNTDYLGFLYTLKAHNITVSDKKCIILGNGGANKAIVAALTIAGCKNIIIVNRSLTEGVISYEECYASHTDADLIVNTTPVGMYPNVEASPLNLESFKNCTTVIDIIYNPLATCLLQQASTLGMTAINGLEMLVAQAIYTAEYFLDKKLDETIIASISDELTEMMKRQTSESK